MPKKTGRTKKSKATGALSHLVVCLSGTLSQKRSKFEEYVTSNGGQCKSSVTKAVTHLVSTNLQLLAATSKVIKAQSCGIPMVTEEFVHATLKSSGPIDETEFLLPGPRKKKTKRKATKMEQSVKKKSNSSPKEDPLRGTPYSGMNVNEFRDLLKHLKERGLSQKKLISMYVPAIITDKGSTNFIENAIKDVFNNDAPVLKARLKHAHATLGSHTLFQLGHERDLGYLLRYLPVYSCSVSTAGDNLPDHTVCSRFANVKDVRESIEWDTRVQECGGKIGFRTHNDGDDVSVNLWTWGLRGYVAVHFDRLVEVFGEPRHCSGPYMKVDWEWHIEFEDGTSGRIYNWKNGPNSLGPAGLNKYEIGTGKYVGVYGADDWHVGGKSPLVVSHVENALNFS